MVLCCTEKKSFVPKAGLVVHKALESLWGTLCEALVQDLVQKLCAETLCRRIFHAEHPGSRCSLRAGML